MSADGKMFELGGRVVPLWAAHDYDQQSEILGSSSTRRTINASAVRQTVWRGKARITLSGSGWTPMGLADLDYSQSMVLKCGMPEAVSSSVAAITLPTTRRTDAGYEPYGRAHLPSGDVDTPVALVGDVATCTAVTGAFGYSVCYWPQYTVYADEPVRTGNAQSGEFGWQIVCEEV